MGKTVDLHIHTTASDGTSSPAQVVRIAHSKGLSAIAITDHDTISGFAMAYKEGQKLGIDVVPGIEFSTKYKGMVHLLGYYIDINNTELLSTLQEIVNDRNTRNEKLVSILQSDGIDITYEQMKARFGTVVGRPHFAEILVENGLATDVPDAFKRLVGKGMRYWVPRTTIPLEMCIELILNAGGVPVIAHPYQYGYDQEGLDSLVKYCLENGVMGIEVRHPSHSKEQIEYLEEKISKEMPQVIMTGGSDYHGSIKTNVIGTPEVPYEWFARVRDAAKSSK